jgi:hypothetical protein
MTVLTRLKGGQNLASRLGVAIATWAEVEVRLVLMLTALLKTTAPAAIAMVRIVRSSKTQIDLIEAVGRKSLVDPELELFEAIINISVRTLNKRNLLAHDPWGHCDELPDALLRIEAGAAVQVMLNCERLKLSGSLPLLPDQHPDLRINRTKCGSTASRILLKSLAR